MDSDNGKKFERLYSFSEAARLIPSEQGGCISLRTLHRWRKGGRILSAVRRRGNGRDSWFLTEGEVARLRGEAVDPAAAERSANIRVVRVKDDVGAALARCDALLYGKLPEPRSRSKPKEIPPG